MTAKRADGVETRRRLLDAAGILFAKKGFREAKTADICREAKANIAAVNYHFRSKEELYAAAWQYEFDRSIAAYPVLGGVAADAPAEARLRGHIQAMVRRFMDPASRDLDMVQREMANPTGLLAKVMHASLEPLRQIHLSLVRELLGPAATGQEVQLCEMSIHAQCFASLMQVRHRRLAPHRGPHEGPPPLKVSADTLAEHVTRFSLAGVREMRRHGGMKR